MRYKNYKRKRENEKIEAIAFFIIVSLFAIYFYRDVLFKILLVTIAIGIIITIFYLIFKQKKQTNYAIEKKKDLEEKKEKLKKYFDIEKEITPLENMIKEPNKQEESLHVNQDVRDIEKQFFNYQKTIYKPKTSYWENKKRGDDYEEFVGRYYENQGYKVTYHGLERGKKDGGIDLIAENEKEILLIQCKAWKTATVKQKHVKEFIGNCTIFLENNQKIKQKIRRIFITSSEKEDKALTKYLQENSGKIEFIIMPF